MADDPPPSRSPRAAVGADQIPALTGFRALAAAMVFVGHVESGRPLGRAWPIHYGWTGVNLFFALSGFLFTLLYFERMTAARVSLREYFLKRAFRVLPLTWLLVLASWVLVPRTSPADLAAHLTLTQAYFAAYRFSLNPPMWSLCVEESFYLAVPALFVALGAVEGARPRAPWIARAAAVAACVAVLTEAGIAVTPELIALKHRATGAWDDTLWSMTLTGRISDFGCGIVAGVVALRAPRDGALYRPAVASALVAAGAALWALAARWIEARGGVDLAGGHAGYQLVVRLFSASGALLVLGLYAGAWGSALMASRPIVYAGRISFALYLAQDAWIGSTSLLRGLGRSLRALTACEPLIVLAAYALVSALAALLHHAVEDPAQRALRRRFLRG